MTYKKILPLFLLLTISSQIKGSDLTDAADALFVANTTTPKASFYVLDATKNLIPFYVQGGTLAASGKEGIVIVRQKEDDTTVTASNLRSWELPDGSSKLLIAGYTNWSDPYNFLGVIIAGTQNHAYGLLYTEEDTLRGGKNWGNHANMDDLSTGYYETAEMTEIFANSIGNIIKYASRGIGVYYALRGTSSSTVTDTVYRFIKADFNEGIENAAPTALITSNQNGAPATITGLEVVSHNNDTNLEQLLIGSNEGLYITTVVGGIQEAGVAAADVTMIQLAEQKNQGIKYIKNNNDGTFNIAGRLNAQTYAIYNVTITVESNDVTNPTITVNTITSSTSLTPEAEFTYPDILSGFIINESEEILAAWTQE